MISSRIQNLIRLLSFLLLLNVISAVFETPNIRQYPVLSNNQRSADSGYRYAWFTRDIHDDMMSDEENNRQDEGLSAQRLFRLKMLKNIYNRKYLNKDETLLESNEKL